MQAKTIGKDSTYPLTEKSIDYQQRLGLLHGGTIVSVLVDGVRVEVIRKTGNLWESSISISPSTLFCTILDLLEWHGLASPAMRNELSKLVAELKHSEKDMQSSPPLQYQYRISSQHRSSTNIRYSEWVPEAQLQYVEDSARELIDSDQYSVVRLERRSLSQAEAIAIREVVA